jgi:hypothetical protein
MEQGRDCLGVESKSPPGVEAKSGEMQDVFGFHDHPSNDTSRKVKRAWLLTIARLGKQMAMC